MTKRDAVSSYKVPVDERDGMLFPVLNRPKTVFLQEIDSYC